MRSLIIAALVLALAPPLGAQTIGGVTPLVAGPATLSATAANDAACGTTSCLTLGLGGFAGVSVQFTGTCGTCTLLFSASVDGTTFVAVNLTPLNSTTPVTSTSTAGVWQGNVVGKFFRIRQSARSSGGFVVSSQATLGLLAESITDSGAAVPGGADTQCQFNDAGSFGGTAGCTFNKSTGLETLTALAAGTASGIFTATGATPAVSNTSAASCGTTDAAMTAGSTNNAGSFTVGATSGTDCTLTFTVAAPNRWQCAPSDTTTGVLARGIPVSATATRLVGAFVAADVVAYVCIAQ